MKQSMPGHFNVIRTERSGDKRGRKACTVLSRTLWWHWQKGARGKDAWTSQEIRSAYQLYIEDASLCVTRTMNSTVLSFRDCLTSFLQDLARVRDVAAGIWCSLNALKTEKQLQNPSGEARTCDRSKWLISRRRPVHRGLMKWSLDPPRSKSVWIGNSVGENSERVRFQWAFRTGFC